MTDLSKYSRTFGDVDNGFYTEKSVVRNTKGELIVKYIQYIDHKKIYLTRNTAWIDHDGDLEVGDICYFKSY